MSQRPNRNSQNSPERKPELNEEILNKFLENQRAQLYNEQEELKLRHKELELNTRLAEKSMEYQAAHLAKQPHEGRKNITRVAYIVCAFVIIFLTFIVFCLYLGKDAFLVSFLKNGGYLLTTFMGYWFGRRVGKAEIKKKNDDVIDEVEVIKSNE